MAIYSLYSEKAGVDEDLATEYAELFLEGLDTAAFNPEIGKMCDKVADWYEKKYMFTPAIYWRNRALEQYEVADMQKEEMAALYSLAKLHYRKGEYHFSLQYLTDVLPMYEKAGDMTGVMEGCNLLGSVYFACGDYSQASEYYQTYYKEAKRSDDSVRICVALNNLAACNVYGNDMSKSAGRLMNEALQISRTINDTTMLCRSWLNLSSIYLNSKRYEEAGQCLETVSEMVVNTSSEGWYWLNNAILYRKTGDTTASNKCILSAVGVYEKGEFDIEMLKCYKLLIDNYKQLKDSNAIYRVAWAYYEVAERISDRKNNLQLFQYQNQIIEQKEAEKIAERKAVKKLYIVISTSLIIIIIMVFWIIERYRYFQMRRQEDELAKQILINKKNELEIRSQNDILEIKRIEQYKTKSIVMEMTDRIRKLNVGVRDRKVYDGIMQILSECNRSLNVDTEEMLNFIPDSNDDAFRAFLKDFPDLTINEKRLCALLYRNLSTKEISEITRQTPHSINIARCRLRNKLGLKGSKLSIQEFLSSYSGLDA